MYEINHKTAKPQNIMESQAYFYLNIYIYILQKIGIDLSCDTIPTEMIHMKVIF